MCSVLVSQYISQSTDERPITLHASSDICFICLNHTEINSYQTRKAYNELLIVHAVYLYSTIEYHQLMLI